jgi:hypothetical protein
LFVFIQTRHSGRRNPARLGKGCCCTVLHSTIFVVTESVGPGFSLFSSFWLAFGGLFMEFSALNVPPDTHHHA